MVVFKHVFLNLNGTMDCQLGFGAALRSTLGGVLGGALGGPLGDVMSIRTMLDDRLSMK